MRPACGIHIYYKNTADEGLTEKKTREMGCLPVLYFLKTAYISVVNVSLYARISVYANSYINYEEAKESDCRVAFQ